MIKFSSEKLNNRSILRSSNLTYCVVALNIIFLLSASDTNSIGKNSLKVLKSSRISSRSTFLRSKKRKKRKSKNRFIATITIVFVTLLFCSSILFFWLALRKRKVNSSVPPWKLPKPGINVEYRCSNPNCASHQQSNNSLNNRDYVYKPYYSNFNINHFCYQRERCIVPGCTARINTKDITDIVMHKCSYVVKGFKIIDSDEVMKEKEKSGRNYKLDKIDLSDQTSSAKNTKSYPVDNRCRRWLELNIEARLTS